MRKIAIFLILFSLLPKLVLAEEIWRLNDVLSIIDNAPELKILKDQLDSAGSKLRQAESLFTTPRLNSSLGYSRGKAQQQSRGQQLPLQLISHLLICL